MDEEMEPMEDMLRVVQIDGKDVVLNCEQAQIFDFVMAKVDDLATNPCYLFVSGPAGTGKTLLLKAFRNQINKLLGENSCLVTAPTDIAAEKHNAKTIDSVFLLRRNNGFEKLPPKEKKTLKKSLNSYKVILIDVINYVTSTTLAQIDFRLQDVLGKKKPFGGLSVIVMGDLLQMQPNEEPAIYQNVGEQKQRTNLWRLFEILELRDNERLNQDNHWDHSNVLEKIRSSDNVGFVHRELLKTCDLKQNSDFGVTEAITELQKLRDAHPGKVFVILVPHEEMSMEVHQNMVTRNGPVKVCVPQVPPKQNEDHDSEDSIEEDDLEIGIGCQVMLTCDLPDFNLVAGTFGLVKGFEEDTISVQFASGTYNIERLGEFSKQFPIRLADSLTIENSQGIEVDGVILVAKNCWDSSDFSVLSPGHIYTALSRAKGLELCRVTPFNAFGWKLSKSAKEEVVRMQEDNTDSGTEAVEITHVYLSEKME
ncbi:hypothetical protein CAEBREN_30740 [Caenorhabditis brenneri]|uniref:ATP-dependent DNA helicase n=1 Tax=Caenorhabditis brenneri TaxID=135651 RepID=G0PDY7_CAEBE|nr:hypothetical protein CAEBREN_30740 [Caenorhabditis brenneri]